jgi:hypothetical protein
MRSTIMKKSLIKQKCVSLVVSSLAGLAFCGGVLAQSSSSVITYQGILKTDGNGASGPFDFVFSLFNVPSGGAQIGASVTNLNVSVTNGLFTTSLDFGMNAYSGGSRWLDISVRTNGSAGAFTGLMPRQAVTAAPLAVFALTGNPGPAGTNGVNGTNGVSGTTGQNATTAFGTSAVTISGPETALPGLTQTVTVPANSVVYIATDGGFNTQSVSATGFSEAQIYLKIDGNFTAAGGYCDLTAINSAGKTTAVARWSLSLATTLTPGSHTIAVYGTLSSGSPVTASGDSSSSLEGELTVMFLKK